MTESQMLLAEKREILGKGAARSLRRQGKVPAIIYGAGKQPVAISLIEKEITTLYRKKHFISTVINLNLAGQQINVLPKQIDLHPISDEVRHLDFVFLEETIQKVSVPIVYEGKEKSIGVKRGGFFNIIKRTIPVLCPVNNIPRNITIDVSKVGIGQSLKASKLELPEGCSLLAKKDFIIASITGRGGKSDANNDPEVTTTDADTAKAKPAADKSAKPKTDKK